MKAVVLIVGVLTGAMFFTSLIVTTRLTGTLNPAETVKLIGEPYEESSDFSNTVESYMLQVLEQFQLKTLFESDGAYNPDKVIDVMSYFGASGADAENHSGLVYRLSDLIEWSKAYSVESGGVYDKNAGRRLIAAGRWRTAPAPFINFGVRHGIVEIPAFITD